jgi:hypothetical protein
MKPLGEPPGGFLSPTTWRPGISRRGGNRRSLLLDECRRGRAAARGARRGAGGNERSRECRAACGACLPAAGSGQEQGFHNWPSALKAFEIAALADLTARGWRVTVEAAGALFLPGETLHIVIPDLWETARGVLRAVTESDPRSAVPPGDQLDGASRCTSTGRAFDESRMIGYRQPKRSRACQRLLPCTFLKCSTKQGTLPSL